MQQYNNAVATDCIKRLVWMQRLLTAAEQHRYAALVARFNSALTSQLKVKY
jgi:hypothetical protein